MHGFSSEENTTPGAQNNPAAIGPRTIKERSLAFAGSSEFPRILSYRHAMEEFITWFSSEPRLSFSRVVVLRYRFFLEQKGLAPSTINVRLELFGDWPTKPLTRASLVPISLLEFGE